MFTGLVREVGRVVSFDGARLVIESTLAASIGDSVAIDGCCLTVVDGDRTTLAFDAVPETLARTTLGTLEPGAGVNLEPALRAGEALGGHYVQGHVDGVGRVRSVETEGDGRRVWLDAPENVLRYCVEKGSITVDGVSLTVAAVDGDGFAVALVPHTLAATTFGALVSGADVNLEARRACQVRRAAHRATIPGMSDDENREGEDWPLREWSARLRPPGRTDPLGDADDEPEPGARMVEEPAVAEEPAAPETSVPVVAPEPVAAPEPVGAPEPDAESVETGPAGEPSPAPDAAAAVAVPAAEAVVAEAEPEVDQHADGDLDIPDGYAVLEGSPVGHRRSVAIVVSRFNGEITNRLLDAALDELDEAGVDARRGAGDARPGRVRAPDRGDGAREDAPLRLRGRARLRDPRRDAPLRLRRERGGERPAARRDRDGRARLLRRAHLRHGRAGRGPGRARRRAGAHRARDGRRVRAAANDGRAG